MLAGLVMSIDGSMTITWIPLEKFGPAGCGNTLPFIVMRGGFPVFCQVSCDCEFVTISTATSVTAIPDSPRCVLADPLRSGTAKSTADAEHSADGVHWLGSEEPAKKKNHT